MSALLSEILDPSQVVLELREGTAAEAILEIAELLRDHGHVQDYFKFADAVMEREGRSSTNTGEGVAFPHARTDLVDRIVLGIGRSTTGIRFGPAKELVHLIFLFGVPRTNGDRLPGLRRRGGSSGERRSKAKRACMAATTAEEFSRNSFVPASLVVE